MPTFAKLILSLALVAAASAPTTAAAQIPIEKDSSPHSCDKLSIRMKTDPHATLGTADIARDCWISRGAALVSDLIRRSHHVQDTTFWSLVLSQAGSLPSQRIHAEARDLAADRAADRDARLGGFRLLVNQRFGPGALIHLRNGESMQSQTPVRCDAVRLQVATSAEAAGTVQQGRRADAEIKALTERIIMDPSEAPAVRSVARCVRTLFRPAFVPMGSPSNLQLTYWCDGMFRVVNRDTLPVTAEWTAEGGGRRGTVRLPGGGSISIIGVPGAALLLQSGGRTLQRVESRNHPCSP